MGLSTQMMIVDTYIEYRTLIGREIYGNQDIESTLNRNTWCPRQTPKIGISEHSSSNWRHIPAR